MTALNPVAIADNPRADSLFPTDRLLEIAIEMPPEDWDALCAQTRDIRKAFSGVTDDPFTYFRGDITIDGNTIASVGIRKKGFIGSLDRDRPSLKIKFNEYVKQTPIDGLDRLTLNNNKQDSSQISQYLAYKTFNAAGIHAPRCSFARVTVNGRFLGVYSHVESVRKPFLRQRFGSSDGTLYEGTLADFYPKAIDRLELKSGPKGDDRTTPRALAEILAADTVPSLEEIGAIVDLGAFLKFWAIESLIGFWDGYSNNQNNYFVYEKPDTGKLYFMPWGADGAFTSQDGPFGRFGNQTSPAIYAQSMLANRLFNAEGAPDRYRETLRGLLNEVWKEDEMLAETRRIETLLQDHLHPDQRRAAAAMETVRNFIRSKRAAVETALEDWPAPIPDAPRKPSYTVHVGSAEGRFATRWNRDADGSATVRIVLDGEPVDLEQITASAQPAPPPPRFGRGGRGFGRRGLENDIPEEAAPASIVLRGVRKSNGEPVTLTVNMARDEFVNGKGRAVAIDGTLTEGEQRSGFGFGFPGGGGNQRSLRGEVVLTDTGVTDGEAVSGEFNLTIHESRGGFFDRFRNNRRGPDRFRRPRPN